MSWFKNNMSLIQEGACRSETLEDLISGWGSRTRDQSKANKLYPCMNFSRPQQLYSSLHSRKYTLDNKQQGHMPNAKTPKPALLEGRNPTSFPNLQNFLRAQLVKEGSFFFFLFFLHSDPVFLFLFFLKSFERKGENKMPKICCTFQYSLDEINYVTFNQKKSDNRMVIRFHIN